MASGELASPAISDALVILGAAGLVIPVFTRFRITPVIGFILIGILVGPYGLGQLVYERPLLEHFTISDPEALEAFTGSREMSGKAMMAYFAPLKKWLDKQNKGMKSGW